MLLRRRTVTVYGFWSAIRVWGISNTTIIEMDSYLIIVPHVWK
jgi:hypothetical protein